MQENGVEGMRDRISPAALYGGLTRGARIEAAVRPTFRAMLEEIRSGRFAAERTALAPGELEALRARARHAAMEAVRARIAAGAKSDGGEK